MDYSIDGIQSEFLKEAAQVIKADIKSLRENNKQTKSIKLQISELLHLHEKIKGGELYGLIKAASFLAGRLPELEDPKRGQLLEHKKKTWAFEDLKDIANLYAADSSPFMIFHDQEQLSLIGTELEKVVSSWTRAQVDYNCVIHMIRTEYLGRKCELLQKQIKQLEEQRSKTRQKELEHGESKAKGRQKRFMPRDALYERALNGLKLELDRELTSNDYRSWSKYVLREDSSISDTTLRTAYKRLTGCNPTSKKRVI